MKKVIACFVFVLYLLPVNLSAQDKTADSLKGLVEEADDAQKMSLFLELSHHYGDQADLNSSFTYAQKSLKLARQHDSTAVAARALNVLGLIFYVQGKYDSALFYWEGELELRKEEGKEISIASCLNRVGVVYKNMGKYDDAVKYYQESANLQDKIGDLSGRSQSLANIGNIYYFFRGNYDKALEYYELSLEISRELRDYPVIANLLNSIGSVYQAREQDRQALEYFEEALNIYDTLNTTDALEGRAITLNNLGRSYANVGRYQEALHNCNQAVEIFRQTKKRKEQAIAMRDIGFVYYEMGQYDMALNYYTESLGMIKAMGLKKEMVDYYYDISKVHEKKGNYVQALDYYKKHSELKDSIFNKDSQKLISELETKFKTQEKEKQLAEEKAKNFEKEKQLAQEKAENLEKDAEILRAENTRNMLIVGLFVIVVLALWLFNRFLIKKKSNELLAQKNALLSQQKEEIQAQRDELENKNLLLSQQKEEIEAANEEIAFKNKEITDSITYARRIQEALLPPPELLTDALPEHFVLFKPRDIVSGDFYWMTQKNNKIFIAAADCTGHGVPGAFMSMLGMSFLNEIVNKNPNLQAHEILNQLRSEVKSSLRQTGKENEAKDGMDIAFCVIDRREMSLQFSGAYNPLYRIRDKELEQFKADRMPIGIYLREKDTFTSHEVDLQPDDTLYIFSDGYADQFGGEDGRKFMSKRFKKMLIELQDKSMAEQREILNTTFEEWRGEIEQIDDVIVIGIKILPL